MSGVEVASGIAGLIAIAFEVTNALAKYAIAVKDHSKNVKELQDELYLLANVLSRLAEFIQDEKAKARSFEQDSVLVKAISDCKKRIERIGDKIRVSEGSKVSRTIDKLKWPFEQKDVQHLVEGLRRYIHTFEFAVTIKNSEFLSKSWDDANKSLKDLQRKVDQACETNKMLGEPIEKLLQRSQQLQTVIDILPTLSKQSDDIKEVSQVVKLAEQREQERRKAEILDWLAPLSTLNKHVELQNRRAPGTCRWLLESEMFIEWADSDSEQYDMLCQGGPGVGKTILSSLVTDHLRAKYKDQDVAVAYYYFDLSRQQAQTDYSVARSILRQLCQNSLNIPTAVAEFYQRSRNELQDSLWLQELQSILQRVIATFSQCFIIVDAFDEMNAKKRKSVNAVLENIRASSGCVKFFATTRPHVVLEHFQNAYHLEVRADESDLRQYLSQKIDAHSHALEIIDDSLRSEMLDKLCAHADGVFLLPALQIDQILDEAVSAGDIERALADLSTDLKEVFQSTIVRIESFTGSKRSLAFKTLMWLSHARRPLRISELSHAIAVRLDKPAVDQRDLSSISVILDSCCGLVELDGESACVKFVHGSIAEYLQSQDHGYFQNAELEIVRVSLKYLTLESLKMLPFKNRNDFSRAMETYPFLDYASSFWGFHARGLDVQQYSDLALTLLNSSAHMLMTARVKDLKTPDFRKWRDRMLGWSVSGGAGISIAASFGLADLTRLLISQSQTPKLDAKNMYGSTPLHECAIFGYQDTAEVLIAHGADLLDSNRGKATPFYLAVSYGQLEMCKMLLKYGRAQLDVPCKEGNTALHKAADLGSDIMVEFLLQSGALIEARNHTGATALHLAARRGHTSVVQKLVLSTAKIQATNTDRLTALDFAATGGYVDTVDYLLRQGADINHKSKEKWTALTRAARSGHTEIINLLLAAGANYLDADQQGCIPFQLAVKSGNLEAVKAFMYHQQGSTGKQLEHQDRKGDRAIHVAFYTSHYHIYEFLRDIESEMMGHQLRIQLEPLLPLIQAIEQGSLPRVQELLAANPTWHEARDNFNQTALHTAFRTQKWEIAEYLLQTGSPINSRGYHAWTPLHIASSLGDLRMLQLALQYDADVFAVSDTVQSVLHKAASARSAAVLTELLLCGCLPSSINDRAMSPIHVAARVNWAEGILIMIRPEFGSPNLLFGQDKYGRTPRDWALRAGHLDLASILRDEERRARGQSVGIPELINNWAMVGSEASQLSRQSTRDSLARRSTSSSLLAPALERSASSRESTMSLPSLEESRIYGGGGSAAPSPGRVVTPSPRVLTPAQSPNMNELELRYAEMQLDLGSD